jgi:hypothetical protein
MYRGDIVKVTNKADGSVRIEKFLGSGEWGLRFESFQLDDFEVADYTYTVESEGSI